MPRKPEKSKTDQEQKAETLEAREDAIVELLTNFEKGQKALGLQDAQTVAELGFFALEEFSADRNPEAIAEEYSALTKEWRRAAGNRRITRETCAA